VGWWKWVEAVFAESGYLDGGGVRGAGVHDCRSFTSEISIYEQLIESNFQIISVSGKINVIDHTIGILIFLPCILNGDEIIRKSFSSASG
jgi:hypothetical protein